MAKSKSLVKSREDQGTKRELDWFELAFGFKENPSQLYERDNEYISVQYNGHDVPPNENDANSPELNKACPTITCKKSGEVFQCGFFSTPSLNELRERNIERMPSGTTEVERIPEETSGKAPKHRSKLKLSIEIGDAAALHEKYPFSTIQVASQLNCLEFVSPTGNPENGVTKYS